MARRKYTPEQIISKLREVEVALAQGGDSILGSPRYRGHRSNLLSLAERVRWSTVEQAKRLKELEKENLRLRRAVSDLTLES